MSPDLRLVMNIPCPHCDVEFIGTSELYLHVKNRHNNMLTWDNFQKVGSHYVTSADGFYISFEPTLNGYRMVVYGTLAEKEEPVLPDGEPTAEQKLDLLILANEFNQALRIAKKNIDKL